MDLHVFRVLCTCFTLLALPLATATAQQDQQRAFGRQRCRPMLTLPGQCQ